MRTIPEIQKEIDQVLNILWVDETNRRERKEGVKLLTKRKLSKYKAEVEYKKQMIMYLEHNPLETNLRRDLGQLQLKLDRHKEGFDFWLSQQAPGAKSNKTKYNAEMGIKEVRKRISTLRYLLN